MSHPSGTPPIAPAGSPPWVNSMLQSLIQWARNEMNAAAHLPTFTVATLPDAADYFSSAASNSHSYMIYVSNESGGAVPAFTDGTNWRRVTDRAIVS